MSAKFDIYVFIILYCDGHQFHQYQQNEQSHLINSPNIKKKMAYDIRNPGPVL